MKYIVRRLLSTKPKLNYFEYGTKPSNEKSVTVNEAYQMMARTYESMIKLSTLGLGKQWRADLIDVAKPLEATNLLDAAGGQGATAMKLLQYRNEANCAKNFRVTVCDINPWMMNVGKEKLKSSKYDSNLVDWVEGDVQNLPFEDETFDCYLMSYGFRSLDIHKTLSEAYRVLKPGSKFYCLDVSRSEINVIAKNYGYFLKYVTPPIAKIIWNKPEPFVYFSKAYSEVPSKEKLKNLLENVGFTQVGYKSLSLGIVAIHFGCK